MNNLLTNNQQIASAKKPRNDVRVPKLRFKEFEGDWKKVQLGETCIVKTGGKDTQDRIEDGIYPFFVRSNTVERINSYSFDGEAILTSGDGVGVGKNFHYVNEKFDYHQRVYALHSFKNGYSGGFIYQVFAEKFYKRVMRLSAKNSVDSVRMSMITEMKIGFPKLPEQQKIATFLTAVDTKIQQLKSKKSALQTYKKGAMQQLFSQQIRFKADDASDFADWEEKKLGEVSDVNPKNSQLPSSFIYIDLESVNKGRLILQNKISLEEAPSRAQRVLELNDILFQTVRPYQMNNLYFEKKGNYIASTGYAQLRTKESSMFLYQLLHTHKFVNNVLKNCTGTSYPAINSNDLAKIKINIPSLKEQQKIAKYLSAIDIKIESVQQQIKKTQAFKKGLLQQMFV